MSLIQKDKRYSDAQNVASAISGYEHYESAGSSARDDGYYDVTDEADKLEYVYEVGAAVYSIYLTEAETRAVVKFLDESQEADCSNTIWQLFTELDLSL